MGRAETSGLLLLALHLATMKVMMNGTGALMLQSRPQTLSRHKCRIMGWGYEGKEFPDLVKDCADWGITTVVDVRLTPWSHKPGFTKAHLSQWLGREGINYVHLKALGNPKANRSGFTSSSVSEQITAKRLYEKAMDNAESREALQYLADLSSREPVLLLCFEKNEGQCHRSVIKELLRRIA